MNYLKYIYFLTYLPQCIKLSYSAWSHYITACDSLHIILQANEAAKLRVDVVNFSYGEACHWVDKGSVCLYICLPVSLCGPLYSCGKCHHRLGLMHEIWAPIQPLGIQVFPACMLELTFHRHLVYIRINFVVVYSAWLCKPILLFQFFGYTWLTLAFYLLPPSWRCYSVKNFVLYTNS